MNPIKVERYTLFTRRGGYIIISSSSCVYILVPQEVKEALERGGINLVKDKKRIIVETSLVKERAASGNGAYEYVIVHRIRNLPADTPEPPGREKEKEEVKEVIGA